MNILSVDDLTNENVERLFKITCGLEQIVVTNGFTGQTNTASLFFQPSTRTRLSFERAARELNHNVYSIASNESSMQKGESLADTLETLNALGMNNVILRYDGTLGNVKEFDDMNIINAGDMIEHPTQAFLDLYTILKQYSITCDIDEVKGLNVLIVGDVYNSRVAMSDVKLFQRFGINVSFCMPRQFLTNSINRDSAAFLGIRFYTLSLDKVIEIEKPDVIMQLRFQFPENDTDGYVFSGEYFKNFSLESCKIPFDGFVMAPGPINDGVEITSRLAYYDKRSLISEQVTNGVKVRTALLHSLENIF